MQARTTPTQSAVHGEICSAALQRRLTHPPHLNTKSRECRLTNNIISHNGVPTVQNTTCSGADHITHTPYPPPPPSHHPSHNLARSPRHGPAPVPLNP